MPHTTHPPGDPTPIVTRSFAIAALGEHNFALDLCNALSPISGVARVDVDAATHVLTVEYDTDYLSEDSLRAMITGAGYPIDRVDTDA